MKKVCLVICVLVMFSKMVDVNSHQGSSECQRGWHGYGGHCYFYSHDKRDWFQSERFCRQHGAHLAKIEDAWENAWILRRAPKSKHVLWIGGSDLNEGQWLWNEDFSPMRYTNWNHGEPNGGRRENCVNYMDQQFNGEWNDEPCGSSMIFLCKKKMYCSCHGK